MYFRFVPPTSAFATRQDNPENACFCNNPEGFGCLTPSGLFNLSSCQYNAPLMLSWPHFYQVRITFVIPLFHLDQSFIRGHPLSTYAPRGRGEGTQKCT